MTSLLGVDLGERRIGLAVGDPVTGIARPLRTIARKDLAGDIVTLRSLVGEHHVIGLVVGLPLSIDGSEGDQAARTRSWVEAVAPALGLPVHLAGRALYEPRSGVAHRTPRTRSSGWTALERPTPGVASTHRSGGSILVLQAALDGARHGVTQAEPGT